MAVFTAGTVATAAAANSIVGLSAFKTSGQNSSSATLANDNELFLDFATLNVGRTYQVNVFINCIGPTAGDIKVAYTRTGTLTNVGSRAVLGPQTGTTDGTNTAVRMNMGFALTTAVPYGLDGALNNIFLYETFALRIDVAGRLQLQWAQNAASGTTTVNSGSYMTALCIA